MKIRGKTIALRFPMPPPTRIKHSGKTYSRQENRRVERLAKKGG